LSHLSAQASVLSLQPDIFSLERTRLGGYPGIHSALHQLVLDRLHDINNDDANKKIPD
jgi:hypothetical protein